MGKQYPAQQHAVTRFALTHPVLLALLSAVTISLFTLGLVGDWRAVALAGGVTFLVVWVLWCRWGPARRRERRLYDEHGRLRAPEGGGPRA